MCSSRLGTVQLPEFLKSEIHQISAAVKIGRKEKTGAWSTLASAGNGINGPTIGRGARVHMISVPRTRVSKADNFIRGLTVKVWRCCKGLGFPWSPHSAEGWVGGRLAVPPPPPPDICFSPAKVACKVTKRLFHKLVFGVFFVLEQR